MGRRQRAPIHDRVRDRVSKVGLSNADIAKKTGWHELRVWRLLTGKTKISADEMEVFASILSCDVAELYQDPSTNA